MQQPLLSICTVNMSTWELTEIIRQCLIAVSRVVNQEHRSRQRSGTPAGVQWYILIAFNDNPMGASGVGATDNNGLSRLQLLINSTQVGVTNARQRIIVRRPIQTAAACKVTLMCNVIWSYAALCAIAF